MEDVKILWQRIPILFFNPVGYLQTLSSIYLDTKYKTKHEISSISMSVWKQETKKEVIKNDEIKSE